MGMGDERVGKRAGIGAGDGSRDSLRTQCNSELWRAGLRSGDSARPITANICYSRLTLRAAADFVLFHETPDQS